MLPINPEILSAIIAGTVSIVVSSIVAVWMQRKKLESDYDITLRTDRLTEYRKLWGLTEVLGWYRHHHISQETAKKLLADLDHWYFENGGGMLISDLSIDIFEELLFALSQFNNNAEEIRKIGTRLRAAMAYDIGGRNLPLLRRRPHQHELIKKIRLSQLPSQKDDSGIKKPEEDTSKMIH